jgi:8-oxo-dGTP pyrophosphatase MutT (NUDIX family)
MKRFKDAEAMLKQYGAIPFVRDKKDKIKIVLITSASGYWIFPKGQYEDDLGKAGTAELEAWEEAGVKGRLLKKVQYRTKVVIKSGDQVRLTLYPLEVSKLHEEWPEAYRRERVVVTVDEAKKRISSDALQECLDKFCRDFLI